MEQGPIELATEEKSPALAQSIQPMATIDQRLVLTALYQNIAAWTYPDVMNMALVHTGWLAALKNTADIRKDWLMEDVQKRNPRIKFNFDQKDVLILFNSLGCICAQTFACVRGTKHDSNKHFVSFETFWVENTPLTNSIKAIGRMRLEVFFKQTHIDKKVHASAITFRDGRFYTTLSSEAENMKSLQHEIMVKYSSKPTPRKVIIQPFPVLDTTVNTNTTTIMIWESEKHDI